MDYTIYMIGIFFGPIKKIIALYLVSILFALPVMALNLFGKVINNDEIRMSHLIKFRTHTTADKTGCSSNYNHLLKFGAKLIKMECRWTPHFVFIMKKFCVLKFPKVALE